MYDGGKKRRRGGIRVLWQEFEPRSHLRARILGAFLTLFVAFVLALLCVLSGHKRGYMESANLFTVNTSTLGHVDLKSNIPKLPSFPSKRDVFDSIGDTAAVAESAIGNAVPTPVKSVANTVATNVDDTGGAIISKVHSAEGALSTAINSAETKAQNALNSVIDELARKLGIHQWYSLHVMNWCEGYYKPGYIANATHMPTKNITKCSGAKRNATFDLTDIVGKELVPGISLSDLHWPDTIANGFRALKLAINVMFVFYVIGLMWVSLGLLGVFVALVQTQTRTQALINMTLAWLGFFTLGFASAIATGLATKATDLVNKHGHDIGLSAKRGNQFQGMTWSATLLAFIAAVTWSDLFRRKLHCTVLWHIDRGLRSRENSLGTQRNSYRRSSPDPRSPSMRESYQRSAPAMNNDCEGARGSSPQPSRVSENPGLSPTSVSIQSSIQSIESERQSVDGDQLSDQRRASVESNGERTEDDEKAADM